MHADACRRIPSGDTTRTHARRVESSQLAGRTFLLTDLIVVYLTIMRAANHKANHDASCEAHVMFPCVNKGAPHEGIPSMRRGFSCTTSEPLLRSGPFRSLPCARRIPDTSS